MFQFCKELFSIELNIKNPLFSVQDNKRKMSCLANIGRVEQVNVTLTSTYRWKIEEFSDVTAQEGTPVLSPVFTTADSSVKWHLKLYPNGKADKDNEYLSMSVYYCSKIETDASYEMSIVNADNEVLEDFVIRKQLKLVVDFESQSEAWIPYRFHPKFVKKSFIKDLMNNVLIDDCLTISFEVGLENPVITNPCEYQEENLKDDRLKLFDDFGKLLNNERFSDITFVMGDQKIHAHKAILATRNSVFREMFDCNVKDDKEEKTIVEIADLKYPVLKELFRFLYIGTVQNVYNMADDLFAAADEYCVKGLKNFCEKTLCGHLKIDNALELFAVADIHDADILKKRSLEFIADHANEIVERDEFAFLRPDLMREIVRVMAQKKVITESQ